MLKVRKLKIVFVLCLFLLIISCGSSTPYSSDVVTDAPPTVMRVDPAQGAPGTEVTIFGFGFSIYVANNVVSLGSEAAMATQYTFLTNPTNGEIESITFTVPTGLAAGTYPVVVVVNGNPSNADVTFQVTGS